MASSRAGPVALLLVSGAASLCLAEVALRWLTPFPISEESNRRSHPLLGYVIDSRFPEINSDGFRNPETTLGEAEIVVVGDSHTYGNNVSSRDSFPAQLARSMARDVYNLGVPSYGIYQYWILLSDLTKSGVPDVLLALYPANDLSLHCAVTRLSDWRAKASEAGLAPPTCERNESAKPEPTGWRRVAREWLESNSAVGGALFSVRPSLRGGEPHFELPHGQRVGRERVEMHARATDLNRTATAQSFRDSLSIIRSAHREFEATESRLSVLIIPSHERVLLRWARDRGLRLPEDFARLVANENRLISSYMAFFDEEGIPYVDSVDALVTEIAAEIDRGERLYHENGHPFERGYGAYARAARELLEREAH